MPNIGGVEGTDSTPISFSANLGYEQFQFDPVDLHFNSVKFLNKDVRVSFDGSLVFANTKIQVDPKNTDNFRIGLGLSSSLFGYGLGAQQEMIVSRFKLSSSNDHLEQVFNSWINKIK